ncbi:hypothetical protein [Nostoc sp. FACHB-145]|uniref:hypothetical protein n=1 Tax=Nostoc sp. FACHB-145 TaxID=2692836 RepID=UPI001684BFF5|nr:hypothetical protein [Nostoc sp. FACHB-145]MBD2468733.1 hypothetical protein [Nostoc sp. FACHB-145]
MSVAIPEKFLEKGLKSPNIKSVGCLYPYLETKKLQDGSTALYPRVKSIHNSQFAIRNLKTQMFQTFQAFYLLHDFCELISVQVQREKVGT